MKTQHLGNTAAFNSALEFLNTYCSKELSEELPVTLVGMLVGPSGKPEDANTMHT